MPQQKAYKVPSHIRRLAWALVITKGKKIDTIRDRKIQVAAQTGTTLANIERVMSGKASKAKTEEFMRGAMDKYYWGKERAAALAYLSKHSRANWDKYKRDLKKSDSGKGVEHFRWGYLGDYFKATKTKKTRTTGRLYEKKRKFKNVFPVPPNPDWFSDLDEMFDDDLWFVS